MTEFEKALIDRLDAILAEMKTARDERADTGESERRVKALRDKA